ncbi:hypothetical protein C4D60_Mb05t03430 [Musa balbisiana]|uniref:Uncharacterized protein n=1 Tax=Musa balbisiana TaxID=52838 RepID=A0A4S8JTF5_MUSBA|nr:hypothetical protein C4D60_Mb05t03430 [Musa balbisiana]
MFAWSPGDHIVAPPSPEMRKNSFDGGDEKITAIMELTLVVMLTLSPMPTEKRQASTVADSETGSNPRLITSVHASATRQSLGRRRRRRLVLWSTTSHEEGSPTCHFFTAVLTEHVNGSSLLLGPVKDEWAHREVLRLQLIAASELCVGSVEQRCAT